MNKKELVASKVHAHLDHMETIFKIYYDTLDKLRLTLLKDEYEYLGKMDGLKSKIRRTVGNLKQYSITEFYHEEREIKN